MLTADEIDAAGEDGVQETPPELSQFKEQVDRFEAIYDEVEALQVYMYVHIYIVRWGPYISKISKSSLAL